jgi:VWFA-related protein
MNQQGKRETRMKRNVVTLICGIVIGAAASAQNLTEKIEVNVVNVDVTVTSHGAPARGLTRDDFEVLEDGVPQTITNFYAIENAQEKGASVVLPTAAIPAAKPEVLAAAPAKQVDERFRRRVLVIIDQRHTTRHNRDVALRNLEQFIDDRFAGGAYDWSVAMISDRAYLLLPLTSDKARIHEALGTVRQAMAEGSMRKIFEMDDRVARDLRGFDQAAKEMQASEGPNLKALSSDAVNEQGTDVNTLLRSANRFEQASDITITYSAIRDATRSIANAPGRKIVLLMTGNFSDAENPLGSNDHSLAGRQTAALTSLRERLVREANASDASLYIVDTEGLQTMNATSDLDQRQSNARVFGAFAGSASTVGGPLYWMARETGGRLFTGNFVDRSLRDFDVSSSDFYSLGYRPNHGDDGKYHTITVRLKKPERATLSYRTGYSSVAVEQQLQRAMTSSMAAEIQPSTMPLTMAVGPAVPEAAGAVIVPIVASVPASQLQFIPTRKDLVARIDFFISVFDERGRIVTAFRSVREAHANAGTESAGNFVESEKMRLRPGVLYRIVVAMHDQISDAVGIKSRVVRF